MSITLDWPELLDKKIVQAILNGDISGNIHGAPDKHIESGLAHIFFFGDSVFKLYKTHNDKDHFIKGVLAPTNRRRAYIEHDFAMNKHFGQGVYKQLHGVRVDGETITITEFDGEAIHVLFEMDRLDFDHNLHERLLRKEITDDELFLLGFETARLTDETVVLPPADISWYSQATARMRFLEQFVDWLPEDIKESFDSPACFAAMRRHLDVHKEEYERIVGNALKPDLDNHDENVFLGKETIHIIDVVPPMDCWWFGVPESNLTSLMVNVETLLSEDAAVKIKDGYLQYHQVTEIPENLFEFTRAFSYVISVAHFGSVPEKRDIALRYAARCADIPTRL